MLCVTPSSSHFLFYFFYPDIYDTLFIIVFITLFFLHNPLFLLYSITFYTLPCLALPCLALPCLALPCLALPCLALPALSAAIIRFRARWCDAVVALSEVIRASSGSSCATKVRYLVPSYQYFSSLISLLIHLIKISLLLLYLFNLFYNHHHLYYYHYDRILFLLSIFPFIYLFSLL